MSIHELAHALSIGWRDDVKLPIVRDHVGEKDCEVYSGNEDEDKAGGVDQTQETVIVDGSKRTQWSLMGRGKAENISSQIRNSRIPVFAFSLEEISTLDFVDIPSKR